MDAGFLLELNIKELKNPPDLMSEGFFVELTMK